MSAHDLSDGGLTVSLAESCIFGSTNGRVLGARIQVTPETRWDRYLFGEDQSRILVSCENSKITAIVEVAGTFGVPIETLGEVQVSRYSVNNIIDLSVEQLIDWYSTSLERKVAGEVIAGL